MITLKFSNGDFEPENMECETIEEALDLDYQIWASLGENCDFYYKDTRLVLDTINDTRSKLTEVITNLIKCIDDRLQN